MTFPEESSANRWRLFTVMARAVLTFHVVRLIVVISVSYLPLRYAFSHDFVLLGSSGLILLSLVVIVESYAAFANWSSAAFELKYSIDAIMTGPSLLTNEIPVTGYAAASLPVAPTQPAHAPSQVFHEYRS